ncbi:MAG: phosphotransferase [Bacteroidaceae bacterium]|nr:phosphotransferase [Bacteroidaceae bacterium]
MVEKIKQLYKEYTGREAASCKAITGSGSNRQYFRLSDETGNSLIGVVGTSVEENHAFIYLARHFASKGIPVPQVLQKSEDGHAYLQNDLGSTTLFDAIRKGREAGGNYSEDERQLLRRTIKMLPKIQIEGAQGLDFSQCYPQPAMDETNVMFDLNYFKYCYLKATGIDFHEIRLEQDFREMAHDLTQGTETAFCYRDFQARNVMLDAEGNPYFIDFQGGRRGPLQYDVASFLWQASARYPQELREELIQVYIQTLRQYIEVDELKFRKQLQLVVLFRLLQVLGAYGFRGYFERKKHFLDSIPPALDNLQAMLEANACPYPYMKDVLSKLIATKPENTSNSPLPNGPLAVRIFSFSYKKGIPEDESGNGGGYVFDCRSTHNPGRYEPYKKLTGLDEPVIRFLEDDGEILTFLDSVYKLADAHVERYLQRGFTDLMFSFGCTGGQHRSVYSAQHLAEHLNEKYGIEVRLCHREQNISQTFPKKI